MYPRSAALPANPMLSSLELQCCNPYAMRAHSCPDKDLRVPQAAVLIDGGAHARSGAPNSCTGPWGEVRRSRTHAWHNRCSSRLL